MLTITNYRSTMLQCEAGYGTCADKRIEIAEHLKFDMSVAKAQSVLNMPTMDTDGKDITPTNYDIDVENVEFSYDKRKIIDSLSIHIPEKTTTAIVGPSGGGKTTLCHLIARFWDVDCGSVKLGGTNVFPPNFNF